MEYIGMMIAGGYVAVMAVIDRRKKEIPIIPGVVCLVFIVLARGLAGQDIRDMILGAMIGVGIYGISHLSRGGIGSGDAFVFLITGVALGFFRNLELLMLSLILAAVVSLFLVVCKRVGRHYMIPFIPFMAIAYGMVVVL